MRNLLIFKPSSMFTFEISRHRGWWGAPGALALLLDRLNVTYFNVMVFLWDNVSPAVLRRRLTFCIIVVLKIVRTMAFSSGFTIQDHKTGLPTVCVYAERTLTWASDDVRLYWYDSWWTEAGWHRVNAFIVCVSPTRTRGGRHGLTRVFKVFSAKCIRMVHEHK